MDERCLISGDLLVAGSVRAAREGSPGGLQVSLLDLGTGAAATMPLHVPFEVDDHNAPALLELDDGRILAAYTRHGADRKIHFRAFRPSDPFRWEPETVVEIPRTPWSTPRPGRDRVTYSNLFRLPSGRIVNFFRGPQLDPHALYSDDGGRRWNPWGRLVRGKGGYSPYLKYAQDSSGAIHFVATPDHPRNHDNGIHHGIIRGDSIFGSAGNRLGRFSRGKEGLAAWDLTPVFRGDPDNVAWMTDLRVVQGFPRTTYTVQKDGRGKRRGSGGSDHRLHYSRWDGESWKGGEIAHAGSRLYAGEDDYTGLACLDPEDARVLYLSTNADPVTGSALVSAADGQRHWEIFRGETSDEGASWRWTAVTADSSCDNLRPVVPRGAGGALLTWMRGSYHDYRGGWSTAIVATRLKDFPPGKS